MSFPSGRSPLRRTVRARQHASIIDRPTFDAVQSKLAENARARRVRVESSPAILMGRIFDDRGNRMTPSHSNRDGVRYLYYVSHVLLQRRRTDAGRVTRVPAIQLEKLVVEAIRAKAQPETEPKDDLSDRAVIDSYVTRIIVRPDSIDMELREPTPAPAPSLATEAPVTASVAASSTRRHQLALECASVPIRQRSSALSRGQADAQSGDPGHYSPRRSQGARLDRRSCIGPRSIVRRDRGA
jgi:site-specific DNA recombinase